MTDLGYAREVFQGDCHIYTWTGSLSTRSSKQKPET